MAQAVAGEALVGVRGIFPPRLVAFGKEAAKVVAAGGEQGAQDRAGGKRKNGRDASESFKPGPAEEFHEDGFGLVVEGVRGQDVGDCALGEQFAEGFVAEGPGSRSDGLVVGAGAGLGVDAEEVKRDLELLAEADEKRLVGFGLLAAEAVVDVNGGKANTERLFGERVGGVDEEQEGGGVSAS